MENSIKNYHLIKGLVSETADKELEVISLQYRRFGRIYFKIISVKDMVITIQVRQEKNSAGNYLDAKDLYERAKGLFSPVFDPLGYKLHISAFPFIESVVEVVTPEYVQAQMVRLNIKAKDMIADTGIDKTNLSAWMNGTREMSQPVKAMFYYYFLSKK